MSGDALRLFARPQGLNCPACRLLDDCGSDRTDNACAPEFDPHGEAGPFALHPLRTDFEEHFARVGGVGLNDIAGRPATAPTLGAYLPQVKWLSRLREERLSAADVPTVAIRVKEVFRGNRIRSATEVRAETGLAADVAVVLLLHGEDSLLERLYDADLAAEIAGGGYALVTPPSFSLWEPGRRPDNLLSLRRSFVYYDQLARAGANVCVRVGWVERRDIERLAEWLNHYPITLVSLDLMTYDRQSFDRTIAHLAQFDELTGNTCRYLVDGVRARRKIEALYLAAAAERVTVSNATMTPPMTSTGVAPDSLLGRIGLTAANCAAAREAVTAAHASSVEEFITAVSEPDERAATSRGRRAPAGDRSDPNHAAPATKAATSAELLGRH